MPARVSAAAYRNGLGSQSGFAILTTVLLSVSVSSLAGCDVDDPVTVERVPKLDRSAAESTSERADSRMLAAIIPRSASQQAIFFKLTGPDEIVAENKAQFLNLIQSITFEGDDPQWELPDGWSQEEGSGERIATLSIPSNAPLTVSVTSLPFRDPENTDAYLLANINRWRGQMGLPALPPEKLHAGGNDSEETVNVKLADGTEVTLVNIVGHFQGGMMAGMGSPTRPSTSNDSPSTAITFETPEGWQSLGASGISQATFLVDDARVTVTPLSAAANDLNANINRWREQVGLSPLEDENIQQSVETLTLGDGQPAQYVTLVSPENRDPQEAILGAIAVRGSTMWFIKMTGASEQALAQKSNFESFLANLKLPADD